MKSNWLADIFNWLREVIESAETPFAKLAIFVLPILAPVVPASITGIRLTTELKFHPALSFITALVLEMLGYVGALATIRAIYKWFRKQGSLVSLILNGLAYGFYVLAMYEINVRLGFLAGDSEIANQVFALLSFITIPTGLLAAEHLNERAEQSEQYVLRQEKRQDKLEKFRIKYDNRNTSRNVPEPDDDFQNTFRSVSKMGRPSVHQERVFSYLEDVYSKTGKVPTFTDVMKDLSLSQSTSSRLRNEWIDKKTGKKNPMTF